jgi:hypothetical protein
MPADFARQTGNRPGGQVHLFTLTRAGKLSASRLSAFNKLSEVSFYSSDKSKRLKNNSDRINRISLDKILLIGQNHEGGKTMRTLITSS